MKGTLRIALAAFSMAPLQRWVNGAAIALLALGAGLAVAGRGPGGPSLLVMMGSVLLLLTPVFAGGVALRFASTPSLLKLRPRGPQRLLLGATLAITLLAAIATLPALDWFAGQKWQIPPLQVFMLSWGVIALAWVSTFALSRHIYLMALIGLFPVIAAALATAMHPMLLSNPGWLLIPGLVCWGLFAACYLRAGSITRPELPSSATAVEGPTTTPVGRMLASLLESRGALSRADGLRQYLFGSPSPYFFALTGVWMALLMVGLHLLTGNGFKTPGALLRMLSLMSIFSFSLGFALARRSRLLWLRGGLDRRSLFALAEAWGQPAAMAAWLAAAAILFVPVLLSQAMPPRPLLMYTALQALFSIAVYYGGLAMTRGGWRDVVLGLVLGALFFTQTVEFAPRTASFSHFPHLPPAILLATLIAGLLLRAYAIWSWRALDWRVARIQRMGWRS